MEASGTTIGVPNLKRLDTFSSNDVTGRKVDGHVCVGHQPPQVDPGVDPDDTSDRVSLPDSGRATFDYHDIALMESRT